jgi:hypothetical protein
LKSVRRGGQSAIRNRRDRGGPLDNSRRRFHWDCLAADKRRHTAERQAALNRRILRSPLGRATRAVIKRFDYRREAAAHNPVDLAADPAWAMKRLRRALDSLAATPPETSGGSQ